MPVGLLLEERQRLFERWKQRGANSEGSGRVTHKGKFVLYRVLSDGGYRWRLRSPAGETLAESPSGHTEKAACEAELRAFMADYPGTEVLDATGPRTMVSASRQ